MSLTKDQYKLLDRMNKRLRTWQRQGLSNEVINRVKNELINFYDKYDLNHPSHEYVLFTKSKNLPDEARRELLQIARSMEYAKSSKISYYKRNKISIDETFDKRVRSSYETIRNNPAYGVNNFQDYIRFVDDMVNYRAIRSSLRELDSKIVARTYAYGHERNLTTEEINNIIASNIQKYEYGDDFEIFLKTEIERMEKERNQ